MNSRGVAYQPYPPYLPDLPDLPYRPYGPCYDPERAHWH